MKVQCTRCVHKYKVSEYDYRRNKARCPVCGGQPEPVPEPPKTEEEQAAQEAQQTVTPTA